MSEGWKWKQCLTLRLDKLSGAKECQDQDQVQGSKFGSSWLWCRVSVHLISFMKPPSAKNHTDARTQTVGEAVRWRYPFPFIHKFWWGFPVFRQIFATFSVKARAPWASHAGVQTFKSPDFIVPVDSWTCCLHSKFYMTLWHVAS